MSILTRWLLIPPVNARLIGRYRDYRRHGASAFSATLGCFWMILAWIFIPLEHPRWQRIRAEHKNLYPHINASRPRPLDPVRYLIQTCWLLIGASRKETPKPRRRAFSGLQNIRGRYHQWMNELPERVSHKTQHLDEKKELGHLSAGARRLILGIIVTFSLILALICVTQPFNPLAQFIFLMLLWGVALIVRRMPGRFSALMLIVLSLTVSCRYIWWRYTSTLNWDDPVSLVCGLILLFAETYAWIVLVLGYFQVVWPLNRQPVPLPKDMSLWPSVDIFVPTYNEDLNVVKNTIYASLGIDWPKDKLNIWILDDGGREEFRQFAQNVGVKYIARTTHEHAKAGNINNALKYAKGEFVSIFDCDNVPTRSFLQMTMGWFLKEKQLTIRINRWNNTIEETKKSLESQGAELEKAPYLGEAFYLKNFETIASLNAFQEGRFQIQDVSSMMAAHLADPKPGDQVLDLCAAPGGKSLHAADKMRNQGCVEARDLTEYKVDLIRENVQRAGVSCVVPKVKDAEQLDAEWIGKADVVIADLPCTGYGVIGRKPDIKYYASKEKEEELVRIQRAILANAASYVKPGGTLLYSTCTVNRKENSENAAWFLEQFPFEAVSLDELLPDELKSGETAKGQLQLIPGVHKTDGFFLAKFRKTEEGRA